MTWAAVRLGMAQMITKAVISDIQVKTGMRPGVIPGARSLTTVTIRLRPVAIVPTLVAIRPRIQ